MFLIYKIQKLNQEKRDAHSPGNIRQFPTGLWLLLCSLRVIKKNNNQNKSPQV